MLCVTRGTCNMQFFIDTWEEVLRPDISIVESIVRGTILYFAVFVLMRGTLRRTAGELSMLDFIFVLLVANGAADSMTGGAVSISNGLVVMITVIFWNYVLNSLSWYIPALEYLTAPPPLVVVRDGKMLRRNMRREFLTENELMAQLREQGIEEVSNVKEAYIEGDGNISVIERESR